MTRTIAAGAHAVVEVRAPGPAQVSIERLGLVAQADAHTPATFDVLVHEPGAYHVLYAPVAGRQRRVGTLAVRAAREGRRPSATPPRRQGRRAT